MTPEELATLETRLALKEEDLAVACARQVHAPQHTLATDPLSQAELEAANELTLLALATKQDLLESSQTELAKLKQSLQADANTDVTEPELVGIFGIDVDIHPGILKHIEAALVWLATSHLTKEGLWRVSGSKKNVRRLRGVIDERKAFPLDEIEDPAIVTSLMIYFLQQVPNGLIDTATTAVLLEAFEDADPTADSLMEIIHTRASASKYQLLCMLLRHWRQVVGTEENRMNANGVSTCVFAVVFPGVTDMLLAQSLISLLESLLAAPSGDVDADISNLGAKSEAAEANNPAQTNAEKAAQSAEQATEAPEQAEADDVKIDAGKEAANENNADSKHVAELVEQIAQLEGELSAAQANMADSHDLAQKQADKQRREWEAVALQLGQKDAAVDAANARVVEVEEGIAKIGAGHSLEVTVCASHCLCHTLSVLHTVCASHCLCFTLSVPHTVCASHCLCLTLSLPSTHVSALSLSCSIFI